MLGKAAQPRMVNQSWGRMLLRVIHWHEMLTLPLHLVDLPAESQAWITPVLGAAGGMGTEGGQHGEHVDMAL